MHIQRRDHDWLPFWRTGGLWTVSVRYRTAEGYPAIDPARPSRWRLVALLNGLRGRL